MYVGPVNPVVYVDFILVPFFEGMSLLDRTPRGWSCLRFASEVFLLTEIQRIKTDLQFPKLCALVLKQDGTLNLLNKARVGVTFKQCRATMPHDWMNLIKTVQIFLK